MFYEGKAKKLYSTSDPDLVIAYFKDDATAFNGKKRDTIEDKGVMNNRISELFFLLLEKHGVKTHFVRRLNDREMLCKRPRYIPVENRGQEYRRGLDGEAARSRRGRISPHPIVEYYYKSDQLDDSLILGEHAIAFGWATAEELKQVDAKALKVDEVLTKFLDERGVILVDSSSSSTTSWRDPARDEICPDTCRFWTRRRGKTRQGSVPARFGRRRAGLSGDLRRVENYADHHQKDLSCK